MASPSPRHSFLSTVFVVTALFAGTGPVNFSCNESLPVYAPPTTLFEGLLWSQMLATRNGTYLTVHFIVTNVYTETLQDHGDLTGVLSIVLASDTSYHKTVALDSSYIYDLQSLNTRTGLVTVNPGGSLEFDFQWDFTDDYGRYLPGNAFPVSTDPQCPTIQVAKPQLLILKCSFQVFDRVGQVIAGPAQYTLNFRAGDPC